MLCYHKRTFSHMYFLSFKKKKKKIFFGTFKIMLLSSSEKTLLKDMKTFYGFDKT